MVKEFNFEEEYSKMIENEKPNIIFNDSGSEEDDLREFHDVEPPQ